MAADPAFGVVTPTRYVVIGALPGNSALSASMLFSMDVLMSERITATGSSFASAPIANCMARTRFSIADGRMAPGDIKGIEPGLPGYVCMSWR